MKKPLDGGGRRKPSSAVANPKPVDLKTLIRDHSLFFDRLVDLIPARFYLPTADEDKTPFKFLSKPDKAIAREETRQNLKKVRRARLDPDNPSSTLALLHKTIQADADEAADDEDDGVEILLRPATAPDDRPVTYEELQQRLHRRIEELRSTRNTRPDNPRIDKPKKDKIKKRDKAPPEKRKREEEVKKAAEENKNKMAKVGPPADLSFGKVKIGGEDELGRRRKKKKLSKAQELERAQRLEEAKKDPEKGEVVANKHSWKAAVSRAAGEKVHDDPKLLKESIKKGKKRQQKHAEQWKERNESREKERAEKQKKRTENIRGRIHDKKMRRIEKREKKLMRPGFEGRKEGYVNE